MSDESTKTVPSTSAEAVPEASTDSGDASTPARPDWWAALEKADKKELAKHPIVSGLVGTDLERKTKKAVERALAERETVYAQREAERAAQAEEQRLEALRQNAPLDFADEVGRKKAAENVAKMQADKQLSELRQTAMEMIDDLGLDESDIAPLAGKQMGSTPMEGFKLYVKALHDIAMQKGAKGAVEKEWMNLQKTMEDAARAKILAEINGDEPSPDVGGGKAPAAPRGAKVLNDQKTFESLGKTHKERIDAAFAAVSPRP